MPEVGQGGRRGQAHVAGPDDGHGVARRACVAGGAGAVTPGPSAGRTKDRHEPGQAILPVRAEREGRSGAAPCCRAPSRPAAARGGAGGGPRVLMACTRSGSAPASASTARTKPHQVVAPLLVRWKMPGPAVQSERDDRRRQVGRERRRPVLVVDEAQLVLAVGQAQRGGDHVGAVSSAQPAGSHDGRARVGTPARPPASRRRTPRSGTEGPTRGRGCRRCRRRRSRWTRRPCAPRPAPAASATWRVPMALTVKAASTSVSQRSTAVKAAAVEHEVRSELGEGVHGPHRGRRRAWCRCRWPGPRGRGTPAAPRGRAARNGGRPTAPAPPGRRAGRGPAARRPP